MRLVVTFFNHAFSFIVSVKSYPNFNRRTRDCAHRRNTFAENLSLEVQLGEQKEKLEQVENYKEFLLRALARSDEAQREHHAMVVEDICSDARRKLLKLAQGLLAAKKKIEGTR